MPELPEVETVKRTLENQIIGKKITKVTVYYDKIIENCQKETFINSLIGQTINKMDRYGKYLIFILDDYSIISHLRMEGKFFIKTNNDPLSKHEHIVFELDNQISFRYHDTRKFGKMVLINSTNINEIKQYKSLKKLAKEANDMTYTPVELLEKLNKKNVPIKTALLDQEIICGLGNIYVDEVCFLSRLNPLTSTKEITINDAKNILDSSKIVLEKAIKAGGTTIRSYTSSLGVTGLFQLELLVHSKEKSPCPTCKETILKIKVGGRGTYYCPNCQELRNKKIIGVTGSIATGKTTVTNYLLSKGFQIIDADEIVKELKMKDKPIYLELIKRFDRKFLNSNNEVDNKSIAKFIYENDENRELINQIMHPLVYSEIKRQIQLSNNNLIFVSVPLLFESKFDSLCDEIICVYANEKTQITRLMLRNNISYDEAKIRIDCQMPQEIKCKLSNYIIDNSNDLCYTIEQVNEIIRKVK